MSFDWRFVSFSTSWTTSFEQLLSDFLSQNENNYYFLIFQKVHHMRETIMMQFTCGDPASHHHIKQPVPPHHHLAASFANFIIQGGREKAKKKVKAAEPEQALPAAEEAACAWVEAHACSSQVSSDQVAAKATILSSLTQTNGSRWWPWLRRTTKMQHCCRASNTTFFWNITLFCQCTCCLTRLTN